MVPVMFQATVVVWPSVIVVGVAVILMTGAATGSTVIAADPNLVGSSVDVAVMVTEVAALIVLEAVNVTCVPELTFVETLSVPALAGETARLTVLVKLPVPRTVGVIPSVFPTVTVAAVATALTEVMVGFGGGGVVVSCPPPHETINSDTRQTTVNATTTRTRAMRLPLTSIREK